MLRQITLCHWLNKAVLYYESGRKVMIPIDRIPKTGKELMKTGKKYSNGTIIEWWVKQVP